MYRLQPVARVWKRAGHEHAHGVIEIALAHFAGDGDGANVAGSGARWARCVGFVCIVGQEANLGC